MMDVCVVGGGIVGLATAYTALKNRPGLKLVVLEKDSELAQHQTGRNSGVIHSGIYYAPGSEKAQNCMRGYRLMLDFLSEHDLPYDVCGKIIVSTNENEDSRLEGLRQRGEKNGLTGLRYLSPEELKDREPHVNCRKALLVPQAGITDYSQVARKLAELIKSRGGEILTSHKVEKIVSHPNKVEIITENKTLLAKKVINCSGLFNDRFIRQSNHRIIPFRGEYYDLLPSATHLVKHLIYPVPNPDFPFLGVHFTRMVGGGVEAGPNAVLSFKREGYTRTSFDLIDTWQTLTWPGFHILAKKYWREGFDEIKRSFSKQLFTKALQNLVPSITENDLVTGQRGVRAQACFKDGRLVDDFLFIEEENVLHVANAPSPAATSSLSIGQKIWSMVQ